VAFGGFERGHAPGQPMAEINVTPLVDVSWYCCHLHHHRAAAARALKLDLPQAEAPPGGDHRRSS